MTAREKYHPGYADGDSVDRGFGLLLGAFGIGIFIFLIVVGMQSTQTDPERLRSTERTRESVDVSDLGGGVNK